MCFKLYVLFGVFTASYGFNFQACTDFPILSANDYSSLYQYLDRYVSKSAVGSHPKANLQNFHLIPGATLRTFFDTALRNDDARPEFVDFLAKLTTFAVKRVGYLNHMPKGLENLVHSLNGHYNVYENQEWHALPESKRLPIKDILSRYGRTIEAIFYYMPFNIVIVPQEECNDIALDEKLVSIVTAENFQFLTQIRHNMESGHYIKAINSLTDLMRNTSITRPYEWVYGTNEKNSTVREASQRQPTERQEWNDPMCLITLQKMYKFLDGKMGPELDSGTWNQFYEVQFPFNINGRTFFYGQDTIHSNWFIQELLPNGKMGIETDQGSWNLNYREQFPFSVGNKTFFYAQDISDNTFNGFYWFIRELLPNGKMGEITDQRYWNKRYAGYFSFSIGERTFFYGQNLDDYNWFIQELLPDGKMGEETDHGYWNEFYFVQFPFFVDGRTFFYGQSLTLADGFNWFIQELLPNGKMGQETDQGTWRQCYAAQFSFYLNGEPFFYGQDIVWKNWFVQKLLPNGKMGVETDCGSWYKGYLTQFPFSINERQFFYGQSENYYYNWFIQEIL